VEVFQKGCGMPLQEVHALPFRFHAFASVRAAPRKEARGPLVGVLGPTGGDEQFVIDDLDHG